MREKASDIRASQTEAAQTGSAGEGGWNLIELMIAMVIISIGLLGTGALLTGIIRGNQVSKNVTIATVLAKDKVEYYGAIPYSELPTENSTEDYGEIAAYTGFKRVTEVYADTPAVNMKKIVVKVYYRTGTNPVTLPMIYEK